MVDERCRKKIGSAIEAIRKARSETADVGIVSGFSAIISAVNGARMHIAGSLNYQAH